jgi:hypothetical protein
MDTIVKLSRSTKGRAGALEEQGERFLQKRPPQTRSSTMRFSVKHSMSKAVYVLGLLGAAFTQTGCAHPVMVQPSVMIQPSVGYAQVYGHQQVYPQVYGQPYSQPYGAAPVVVMPRVVPPVVYSPPVYRPVYGFGYGGHRGWGRGGHEGHEGHGGWRH